MLTKTVTRVGIFVALSVVGAFLKVPSPTGTVAFDSAPGYFAAAAFGGAEAALIISIGHLVSSALVGFPLSLPIHFLIAVQMALFAYLFGFLVRKVNGYAAITLTTLANGILAPLSLVPMNGWPFFVAMLPPLLAASFANVLLAYIIYKSVRKAGIDVAG
ncbi:ECF transporter S component [Metallumcola ferriviriculae]|uniref:ECF transporter S component n=1 Tax=Metallumcola ferriviriculae TaxID=3039180 RepID=A0AAU0UM51_9FIRM|nr:ECF transporter S component [Desulfitibacteraceae bacterium MK1]